MKNYIITALISIVVTVFVLLFILRGRKDCRQEVELLRVETEALYQMQTELEQGLIELNRKDIINEAHIKIREAIVNSNFYEQLDYINRSDLEALRVFDRYRARRDTLEKRH